MTRPVVILFWQPDGSFLYTASEGVQVVSIDERNPADRVYVAEGHGTITADDLEAMIGDHPIGYAGDGTPADHHANGTRSAALADSRRH